jgi:hypothetical protein
MPRLMALSLAERQVRALVKTVTRRLGWRMLRVGDQLTLCRKVMGRRRRWAPRPDRRRRSHLSAPRALDAITVADVTAEGFPQMTPTQFVSFFCAIHQGCEPGTEITRIEWRYLDWPARSRSFPTGDASPSAAPQVVAEGPTTDFS